MAILLVTLGVLFAASIVLYLVIRLSAGAPPVALPPLPSSLWLSTALIVVSSVTIQLARGAARRGQGGLLRGGLVLTLLLGAAFLVCQVVSWQPMIEVYRTLLNADPPRPFYVGSFFLLTGLHGAHVLGGLVPWASSRRGPSPGATRRRPTRAWRTRRCTGTSSMSCGWCSSRCC